MTYKHDTTEEMRRPIGLQQMTGLSTVRRHVVLVGIDNIKRFIDIERAHNLEKGVGSQFVVKIEHSDIFPACFMERYVRRMRNTAILRASCYEDALVQASDPVKRRIRSGA